jgi:hypothetical protein
MSSIAGQLGEADTIRAAWHHIKEEISSRSIYGESHYKTIVTHLTTTRPVIGYKHGMYIADRTVVERNCIKCMICRSAAMDQDVSVWQWITIGQGGTISIKYYRVTIIALYNKGIPVAWAPAVTIRTHSDIRAPYSDIVFRYAIQTASAGDRGEGDRINTRDSIDTTGSAGRIFRIAIVEVPKAAAAILRCRDKIDHRRRTWVEGITQIR